MVFFTTPACLLHIPYNIPWGPQNTKWASYPQWFGVYRVLLACWDPHPKSLAKWAWGSPYHIAPTVFLPSVRPHILGEAGRGFSPQNHLPGFTPILCSQLFMVQKHTTVWWHNYLVQQTSYLYASKTFFMECFGLQIKFVAQFVYFLDFFPLKSPGFTSKWVKSSLSTLLIRFNNGQEDVKS